MDGSSLRSRRALLRVASWFFLKGSVLVLGSRKQLEMVDRYRCLICWGWRCELCFCPPHQACGFTFLSRVGNNIFAVDFPPPCCFWWAGMLDWRSLLMLIVHLLSSVLQNMDKLQLPSVTLIVGCGVSSLTLLLLIIIYVSVWRWEQVPHVGGLKILSAINHMDKELLRVSNGPLLNTIEFELDFSGEGR